MTARRMLFGIGAGPLTLLRVSALTAAPHGGWTQKPKHRALWHNDHTITGYVSGTGGIEVVVTPDSTGVGGAPIVLHAAFEIDTHAAPAMIVRSSDHKLLVVYSAHGGTTMYRRVSVNSLDTDPTLSGGFTVEAAAFVGTSVTYPMLLERTAEAGSPIYLFYRERPSSTSVLSFRKSTDGGATWDAQHQVYASTGKSTYWDIALAPDGWRIDFVVTDTVGATDQLGDIRHFYADATDYHKSDGTVISGSQPWTPAQLTLVYAETSAGKAWSHDLFVGADGFPRFLFGIANTWSPAGGTDTEYRYGRWTGSAWVITTILGSAGAGQFDPVYGCLDRADETRAYLTRFITGHYEITRYTTADLGATWPASRAITSGSAVDNVYPVAVADHPTHGRVLEWGAGTYVSATDNSLAIKALAA